MRKTTKLLTVLVAFAMIISSFAMFATNKVHVHAAEPTEYKLGAIASGNTTGAFTVNEISRVKPEKWEDFDRSADFIYADMKPVNFTDGKYVDSFTGANDTPRTTDFVITNESAIDAWVRAGKCFVITFKAPADGEYTVSFDVPKTFYKASVFTSVGENNLSLKKSFANTDVYEETVTLKANETFNIGLSRAHGDDSAAVTPFSDTVEIHITNFKVVKKVKAESTVTYNVTDYFGKAESAPFSFGEINTATGDITALSATAGTGKINQYDAKEWTAYKTSEVRGLTRTDSDAVTDARFTKGKIWEEIGAGESAVTVFTAPADGTYAYEMNANRWWAVSSGNPCAITVVIGEDTKTQELADQTAKSVKGTVDLKAGQTIVFYVDSLGNGASDNYTLNKLEIVMTVAEDEPVVYDINDFFGNADSAPFSFHNYNTTSLELGSALNAKTGTGDNGTGYPNDAWTTYQPVVYNQLTRVDSEESASRPKGTIWGVLAGNASIGILFTAPYDGEYSYHMAATRWWSNNETYGGTAETQPSAVTVKYGDEVKTAKMETGNLSNFVKGTVTLKAGETILFYVDSLGNGSGDDYTLNTLKVTATKTASDEECDHADAEWTITETSHSKICECGEVIVAEADHALSTANCVEAATCEICGATLGEVDKNNHKSEEIEWTKTEDKHTGTFKCCGGVYLAESDHVYGDDNVCDVCGYGCEHKGGEATCENKAVCEKCNQEYGELKAHNYVDGKCTVCEAADPDYEAPDVPVTPCEHSGGTATCTSKAKCEKCGEEYGELKAHNYENGYCTECEDEDPTFVPSNPATSDTTVSIAMMIAGVALLGCAVIPSKKRKAD